MRKNIQASIVFLCLTVFAVSSYAQVEQKKLIAGVMKPIDYPKDILFDIDNEEDYPSSDLYESWQNEKVNPYKISIKDLPDSVLVDLSEYHHPTKNSVTSVFGPRGRRFHYGIDLRVAIGDDIYSAFNGKVRVTGLDPRGYGRYVVVRHDNGLETLYGHLSQIKVVPNQKVKAGDVIGLGGNTGRSTGPHLHFEFRYLGNAINPSKIIDFENYVPYNDTYLICKKSTFKDVLAYKAAKYHRVKSGDTLYAIARRYGTTVDRLCKLNNISRNSTLRPKQRIRYS